MIIIFLLPKSDSTGEIYIDIQRKKIFGRVLNGFKVAKLKNEKIRFMTLTTSPVTRGELSDRDMFKFLQRWVKSLFFEIKKEFGKRPEYFVVRTNEGYGVVHILFRDQYIPHEWLMSTWYRLTGSFIVDIREPRGDPYEGARYLASQYISDQNCSMIKYQMSKNWIYDGWSKDYNELRSICRDWDHGFFNEYRIYCWPVDKTKMLNSWDYHLRWKYNQEGLVPYEGIELL